MGDISRPWEKNKPTKRVGATRLIPQKPPSVKELVASGKYKKYRKGGKV